MSTSFVVRYEMKPERAEENAALIQEVFRELAARQPEGLRYAAFRLADGVTFVHVGTGPEEGSPLPGMPAFQEFQKAFGDRAAAGPEFADAEIIGAYGFDHTPEQ